MHTKQQQGDEYFCSVCNRRWDINDDAPTECVDKNKDKPKGDNRRFTVFSDSSHEKKPEDNLEIFGAAVNCVIKEVEVQLNAEHVYLEEAQLMGISKGIVHELQQANLLTKSAPVEALFQIQLKDIKDVEFEGYESYFCKDCNGFYVATVKPLSTPAHWGFIDDNSGDERTPEMAAKLN